MLKKIHRLPATQKLKNSSFFKTQYFTLRLSKTDLPLSRFGFVVRKTVDKRATARNRIKRVLRSCIEELLDDISSGHDMLFVLEKGIIGKPRNEVLEEVKIFLKKKELLG